MLLTIPVSRYDQHLIPVIEKSFSLFPPGNKNDLLVIGSPNARGSVERLTDSLKHHFSHAACHMFQVDSHFGWPMACGFYFQQTCYHVARLGKPWMWFELDCTPIAQGWLDTIAQEYAESGKPFMGAIERTIRGMDGKLVEDAGYHMVSCGVYPADTADRLISIRGVHISKYPWWEHLQWQIVPYMHETKLIQENWRTINYRRTDNSAIICDSDANLAWTVDYNRAILEESVVVHGCKDGSLTKLLDSENQISPRELEAKKPKPSSRRMSKSARQARIDRYRDKQILA